MVCCFRSALAGGAVWVKTPSGKTLCQILVLEDPGPRTNSHRQGRMRSGVQLSSPACCVAVDADGEFDWFNGNAGNPDFITLEYGIAYHALDGPSNPRPRTRRSATTGPDTECPSASTAWRRFRSPDGNPGRKPLISVRGQTSMGGCSRSIVYCRLRRADQLLAARDSARTPERTATAIGSRSSIPPLMSCRRPLTA